MTDNDLHTGVARMDAIALDAIEDATDEQLRAILGAEYVGETAAEPILGALGDRLSASNPELWAVLGSNLTPFPQRLRRQADGLSANLAQAIQDAERYFSDATTASDNPFQPFSVAYSSEIRRRFPTDADTFREIDRRTKAILGIYWGKALATCLLSLAFSACSYLVVSSALVSADALWVYLVAVTLGVGVYLAAASLETVADRLGNVHSGPLLRTISASFENFQKTVEDASRMIHETRWAERARGWIKVALWCQQRGDCIDRYLTVSEWRLRMQANALRLATAVLQTGILVATAVVIRLANPELPSSRPSTWILLGLIGAAAVGLVHQTLRRKMAATPLSLEKLAMSGPADIETCRSNLKNSKQHSWTILTVRPPRKQRYHLRFG